jgi:hypothetical protein
MANQSSFTLPYAVKNRLRQRLRAKGHEEIADQFYVQHPSVLGPEYIVGTGGGCEAYFVELKSGGQNVLVAWTSDDGGDLATESDYRVGVYLGKKITDEPLAELAFVDSLTLDNAPIGTKAPSVNGGHWVRTESGWKWCTGATFPSPGGDWTGKLILPEDADNE